MRRKGGLAIIATLALVGVVVTQRTRRVSAQGCPPPTYTNEMFPWANGTDVNFKFDTTGFGIGSFSNDPPKFALSQAMTAGLANGIDQWNSNSSANGSNVTFTQNQNGSTFVWTISAAWPQATVTYTSSNGMSHTFPVDASSAPPGTAAMTVYLPDYNSAGQTTGTAAAAVTLINTNGTYSVNGTSYPVWDASGTNFGNAMVDIGTHEAGHGFGLNDQSSCGDVMSAWGPATSSDPSGGTNNQGGCATGTVTNCDDQEILNNPNGLYNTGGDSGDPGQDLCNPTCGSGESPVILDISGNGFDLTSAAGGVQFDMAGTGHPIQIAWTAQGADNAFLAQPGTDGLVHNGKQLFGNFTPQPPSASPNGFAALAIYDEPANGGNGDGVIDSSDAIFSSLRLWIDENHDGICQPWELHTLPSLGVESINLEYRLSRRKDNYGNLFRYRSRVNHDDPDSTHIGKIAYDVFFVTN